MRRCPAAGESSPPSPRPESRGQVMTETPTLEHLMGAYFHQDWMLDAEDEWEVLDQFLRDEPGDAVALARDIEWTLGRFESEPELESYLDSLGNEFRADRDG